MSSAVIAVYAEKELADHVVSFLNTTLFTKLFREQHKAVFSVREGTTIAAIFGIPYAVFTTYGVIVETDDTIDPEIIAQYCRINNYDDPFVRGN